MTDSLNGGTVGPVDMSIVVPVYVTELYLLASMLPSSVLCADLVTRLTTAYQGAQTAGQTYVSLQFAASEQGMIMGCLSAAVCPFGVALRNRIMKQMASKMLSAGAPGDL